MKSCKTGHFHNGLLGNFLVMEINQFIHIAGKDITGFIFSQNNAIVIYKDFKRVMFADIQVASELNRERNSSEIIQLSYNTCAFHKAEEGGFWVSFPDFPECMTQGDSMDEAYEMAIDALGLSLSSIEDEGTDIPKASEFETVDPEDGILVIIEFDMAEYRRKHRSKAVKKTLSIPEWLNEAAVRENLNFSQILQEALMVKLGVNGRLR